MKKIFMSGTFWQVWQKVSFRPSVATIMSSKGDEDGLFSHFDCNIERYNTFKSYFVDPAHLHVLRIFFEHLNKNKYILTLTFVVLWFNFEIEIMLIILACLW